MGIAAGGDVSERPTPRYGHAPVPMRRVQSLGDVDNQGDFAWTSGDDGKAIFLALPSPSVDAPTNYILNRIPVNEGANSPGKQWGWDGNEDAPTLTPSIHCLGHWHGWVRAGQMIEA